jgi:acetolactate synthase-1/2/3 large subunit
MLVAAFATNRVERIFGVPGGGSSLDIIDAAADAGIEFVLTRTESAAVMMAAVTAELNGTLGVALTTKGPGTASATNGVAYASLDRSPVMLLSDGFNSDEQDYVTHQVFDQQVLLKPVTKGFSRLDGNAVNQEINDLIDLAMTPPLGPVYVELTSAVALSLSPATKAPERRRPQFEVDEVALASAKERVANSTRPVVIVGLEARDARATAAIRRLVTALRCPVLATYKAKGVVADQAEQYAGMFTGGAAEAECLNRADLILLCGVDPIEFIRKPWSYAAPVIDISLQRHPVHYLTPAVGLYGSLDKHIAHLTLEHAGTDWSNAEIKTLRQGMEKRLQYPGVTGLGPQQVVELAAEASRFFEAMPRITVDAGAHMFSVMAFWPCAAPYDALISNGLATMAFALPAAIAATMHDPERPVIAFTGDGGLLMCLGELSTAVEQQARIVVIVFNDQSLSLIDIKQQQKGFTPRGVRWSRPDFARVMEGLGGRGYRVQNTDDYVAALRNALNEDGPALIDVSIDPAGYKEQLKALRG